MRFWTCGTTQFATVQIKLVHTVLDGRSAIAQRVPADYPSNKLLCLVLIYKTAILDFVNYKCGRDDKRAPGMEFKMR